MLIQSLNFGSYTILRPGYHEGKYSFGYHIHQFCELIRVMEGELEMTVDGKTELVTAGNIIAITPFQIHSFYTPHYCKIWICVFSNDFIQSLIPFEELCGRRERCYFTPSKALLSLISEYGFENLCANLGRYINEKPIVYTVRSVFHLIMSEYFKSVPAVIGGQSQKTLQRILVYMSEHFRENITQTTVGKALGYTSQYVANCFHGITGMNFRTMLNSLRIEYAKGLLINTDRNVLDIALESGFSVERSFYRAFLDVVGVTPGEYRRQKRSLTASS